MDKQEKEITLKNDFDWFLSDEFKELRQGFEPTDNSEFIKEYCKKYNICSEEKPPCNTTEQGQEPIIEYEYRCYKCVKDNHEADE